MRSTVTISGTRIDEWATAASGQLQSAMRAALQAAGDIATGAGQRAGHVG